MNGRDNHQAVNQEEREVLSSVYISGLTGQDLELVLEKRHVGSETSSKSLESLEANGLVGPGKKTITAKGRESLQIVLAGGVFDIIHPGHIHTLNEAKKLGNVLVVVIATDSTAVKMKKRLPLHSQEQRKLLVDSLEAVDAAVIGSDSDIFKTVGLIKPQIIALGYDQAHQEKSIIDGCKKINLGVTVARLQSPIPQLSSSVIEKEYGDEIHGT